MRERLTRLLSPAALSSSRTARGLATALAFIFVALVVAAALAAAPAQMPGVSLGWPVLLCIERAAAATAVVGVVLLVILNLFRGLLPTEVGSSGVKFASVEAAITRKTKIQVDALRTTFDELLSAVSSSTETEAQPPDDLGALSRRIDGDLSAVEARLRVQAAIDELPPFQRHVILSAFVGRLPLGEVAELLDAPYPGVEEEYRVAMETLRSKLGDEAEEDLRSLGAS